MFACRCKINAHDKGRRKSLLCIYVDANKEMRKLWILKCSVTWAFGLFCLLCMFYRNYVAYLSVLLSFILLNLIHSCPDKLNLDFTWMNTISCGKMSLWYRYSLSMLYPLCCEQHTFMHLWFDCIATCGQKKASLVIWGFMCNSQILVCQLRELWTNILWAKLFAWLLYYLQMCRDFEWLWIRHSRSHVCVSFFLK